MTKLTNTSRVWKTTAVVCLALSLSFSSCNKSDNDPKPTPEQTFVFDVIDAKATDTSVEDFTLELRVPQGDTKSIKSTETTAKDGTLAIDASDFESGEYSYSVTKGGYITTEGSFTFEKESYETDKNWSFTHMVYLNEIEPTFVVPTDAEVTKSFDNGDVIVEIPAGALSSEQEISITRVITPFQRNEVRSFNGKIALDCIHCLPEGTTFEKPVTVKFRLDPAFTSYDNLQLAYYDESSSTWETHPISVTTDGYGVAQLTHFSDWWVTVGDYQFKNGEAMMNNKVWIEVKCQPGVGIDETHSIEPSFIDLNDNVVEVPAELKEYVSTFTAHVIEAPIADCEQHLEVFYTKKTIKVKKLVSGSTSEFEEFGEIIQPAYPLFKVLSAEPVEGVHHGGGGSSK